MDVFLPHLLDLQAVHRVRFGRKVPRSYGMDPKICSKPNERFAGTRLDMYVLALGAYGKPSLHILAFSAMHMASFSIKCILYREHRVKIPCRVLSWRGQTSKDPFRRARRFVDPIIHIADVQMYS